MWIFIIRRTYFSSRSINDYYLQGNTEFYRKMFLVMGIFSDLHNPNRSDAYILTNETASNIPVLSGVEFGPFDYSSILVENPIGVRKYI